MKPVFKAAALLLGIAIIVAVVVLLYVMNAGLSAREQPGRIETAIAGTVRNVVISRRARDLRNPVERMPEVIADGRAHFADHCAVCHANDDSGKTEMGEGMWPRVPDMRLPATQELSDGELFWIIENGIRFTGMPGWSTGTKDGETASWHLVHFIRHLPDISEPELEEMEALNPKPPAEIRQQIEEERFLRGDDVKPTKPAAPAHAHPGGGQ
jgi:mono/diheme cytochrome c family protein